MFSWVSMHILTLVTASPFLGIIILAVIPRRHNEAAGEVALASSVVTLILSLIMFSLFGIYGRFALSEIHTWFPSLGVSYHMAVDGFSALLIPATAVIIFYAIIIYWKNISRGALITLLIAEVGFLGLFSSVDIFGMYIFMEIGVIALGIFVLLINNTQDFIARYFGFMGLGSVLFLVVVVLLITSAGSASLMDIESVALSGVGQMWLFAVLLAGVLIRTAVFPFHGWVKEVCSDERCFLIVQLIFVSGAYFLYRLLSSLAVAVTLFRPFVSTGIVVSILISSLIAMRQKEKPILFAYVVSVYFGFILLGMLALNQGGLIGSGLEIVSMTAVLPLLGRRGISLFLVLFALAGIPGLSDFPGLFMIWLSVFKWNQPLAVISLASFVFVAIGLIKMAGGIEPKGENTSLKDAAFVLPLGILIFAIGIFPDFILKYIKQSAEAAWVIFSRQI